MRSCLSITIVVSVCLWLGGCASNSPSVRRTAEARYPRLWATGSTEKIQHRYRTHLPHDGVFDAATRIVKLTAVRGEHVPFHLVLSTYGPAMEGVTVKVSPIRAGDRALPSGSVRLFYEHLIKVYAATGQHGKRGYWPDPLVPLTRPFTVRAAGPSGLPRHQPLWVDLFVPRDQTAGVYRGSISVQAKDGLVGSVNVELTVVDITLPAKRHFATHIGFYEHHIARMHGLKQDSAAFRKLFNKYLEFFLDNRIDPRTSPGMRGRIVNGQYQLEWPRADLEKLFLSRGRVKIYISPVPQGVPRQNGEKPFDADYQRLIGDHVRLVVAHAKKNGWADRLGFWIPVDEPKRAGQYAAVRHWADAIAAVDKTVPVMVTEQPFTENPAWGSLVGHVNAWCINGNYLFDGESAIAKRAAAGDRMIWYASCDQLYPQPNVYIDREAADLRMVGWITWRYQLKGFLYWTSTYWEEVLDPWRDPITWKWFPCNSPAAGEGSLVYPGHLVSKYTQQENVDGPVGSLRLAMLREGMEELELLRLLREAGGGAEADRIVRSICRNVRDFQRDPAAIDAARAQVIAALLARQSRG
jgi:hypothetical protein